MPPRSCWRGAAVTLVGQREHKLAGGGAIINVSSVFADRGGPTAEYSGAKHGIRGGGHLAVDGGFLA